MDKFFIVVGSVVVGAASYALIGLLMAWLVEVCWNQLIPEIFHLPFISYWQAFGLYILCGLLFKAAPSTSSK
jgi:hypothetical protein